MQWLIDIFNELADIKCAANKVLIHSQLGVFHRGDPAINDWALVDFVTNNAWHALPLFPPVPADAVAVALTVRLKSAAINKQFRSELLENFIAYSHRSHQPLTVTSMLSHGGPDAR